MSSYESPQFESERTNEHFSKEHEALSKFEGTSAEPAAHLLEAMSTHIEGKQNS